LAGSRMVYNCSAIPLMPFLLALTGKRRCA